MAERKQSFPCRYYCFDKIYINKNVSILKTKCFVNIIFSKNNLLFKYLKNKNKNNQTWKILLFSLSHIQYKYEQMISTIDLVYNYNYLYI